MVHPSTLLPYCSAQCNRFLLGVYECVLALSAGKNPSGVHPVPSMNCDNIHCLNLWTSRMHWELDGGIIKQLSISPPAIYSLHHITIQTECLSLVLTKNMGEKRPTWNPQGPGCMEMTFQWKAVGKVLTKTWHFHVMSSSKQEAVLYVCWQVYVHTHSSTAPCVYTHIRSPDGWSWYYWNLLYPSVWDLKL